MRENFQLSTMKSLLMFVFCFVPLIDARSLGGRETDTCIADYLKSKNLVGEEFGSNRPLNPFCSAIVEITKVQILESVMVEVMSDKEMRKEGDCIMKGLRESNFGDNLLAVYVYETSEHAHEPKTAAKLKKLQDEITRTTLNSYMACQLGNKFGELFDDILNGDDSSQEQIDPQEDYCIRKHIIEHKLIKNEHVKLQINPKHLDISNIDCNVLYQKALKDAEDELVHAMLDGDSQEDNEVKSKVEPTETNCLLDVIRSGNFIDQMLQYDYIKEFSMSATTKSQLRSEFIRVMTKLAENASKCFL